MIENINFIKCKDYMMGIDFGNEYITTIIGKYDKKGIYHIIAVDTITKQKVLK